MRPTLHGLSLVAVAIILGAVVVARITVVPALEGGAALVDQNLGTALARPIALRISEIVLGAALLHGALVVPRAPRGGQATVGLLLVAACLLERAWVLPGLYAAWSRVDRVAALPAARVEEASALAMQHDGLLAAIALLASLALYLLARRSGSALDQQQATSDR